MRVPLFTILLFASTALAQSAGKLEFEVASVKLAAPLTGGGVPRGGPGSPDPLHVNYRYVSMKNLLMAAYDLPYGRINGPGWIDTERYDISATLPAGTSSAQLAVMLQTLSVENPSVTAGGKDKDGFPIPVAGGSSNLMQPGRRRVSARKQTMARLATLLADELDRPVIDRTDLTGDYDYLLEYAPTGSGAFAALEAKGRAAGETVPELNLPSLQTAVQEQLGLRLESKRAPVATLVVDGGEKIPAEN